MSRKPSQTYENTGVYHSAISSGGPGGPGPRHAPSQMGINDSSVYLLDLEGIPDSDSDVDTDDDLWNAENREDPYSSERIQQEVAEAKANPMYLAELYWAKRIADRRFRAAKGRFGPKKRFHPRKMAKKFTRRGPMKGGKGYKGGGSAMKGFFIGEHFVSLDHVPETDLLTFFNGKSSSSNGHMSKDMKCFNCGSPGHMSRDCKDPQKCFGCGQPGHMKANCPKLGRAKALVMWGSDNGPQNNNYNSQPEAPQQTWMVLGSRLSAAESEFTGMTHETDFPPPPEPHTVLRSTRALPEISEGPPALEDPWHAGIDPWQYQPSQDNRYQSHVDWSPASQGMHGKNPALDIAVPDSPVLEDTPTTPITKQSDDFQPSPSPIPRIDISQLIPQHNSNVMSDKILDLLGARKTEGIPAIVIQEVPKPTISPIIMSESKTDVVEEHYIGDVSSESIGTPISSGI